MRTDALFEQAMRSAAERKAQPASPVTRNTPSSGIIGDLPKFALSGAQRFVGDVGAVAEAAGARLGRPELEAAGRGFRERQYADIAAREKTLSPIGQRVAGAKITDIGLFGGDVPTLPYLAGKTAEFLPTTLAGGAVGKAIQVGTRGAIGLGAGSVIGESLVSAPSGASAQAQKIDATPASKLLVDSAKFKEAYDKNAHLDPVSREAAARSALKADAMPTGALSQMAAVAAGSMIAGRLYKGAAGGVFNDAADSAKGIIKGSLQGARRESVQETAQSFLESVAGDVVTGKYVDPEALRIDSMMKNAATSALEGAVLGGTVGGVIGAVQGRANAVEANKLEAAKQKLAEQESNKLKQKTAATPGQQTTSGQQPKDTAGTEAKSPAMQLLDKTDASGKSIDIAETRRMIDSLEGDALLETAGTLGIQTTNPDQIKDSLYAHASVNYGLDHLAPENQRPVEAPNPIKIIANDVLASPEGKKINRTDSKKIEEAFSTTDPVQASLAVEALAEEWGATKGKSTKRVAILGEVQTRLQQHIDALNILSTAAPVAETVPTTVAPTVAAPVVEAAPTTASPATAETVPTAEIASPELGAVFSGEQAPIAVPEVKPSVADMVAELPDQTVNDVVKSVRDERLKSLVKSLPDAAIKEVVNKVQDAKVAANINALPDAVIQDIVNSVAPQVVDQIAPVPAKVTRSELVKTAKSLGIESKGMKTPDLVKAVQAAQISEESSVTAAQELPAQPLNVKEQVTTPVAAREVVESRRRAPSPFVEDVSELPEVVAAKGLQDISVRDIQRAKKSDLDKMATSAGLATPGASIKDVRSKLTDIVTKAEEARTRYSPQELEMKSAELVRTKATPQQMQTLGNVAARRPDLVTRYVAAEAVRSDPDLNRAIENIQSELANIELSDMAARDVVNEYGSLRDDQLVDIDVNSLPDYNAVADEDYIRGSTSEPSDAPSLSREQVVTAIRKFQGDGFIPVKVLATESELPKDVVDWLKSRKLYGTGAVRGIYKGPQSGQSSRIFLIAENIKTERDAVFVVLHEAVHRGLAKTFGSSMSKALEAVHKHNSFVRAATDIQRDQNPALSQSEAIEEVIADLAHAGLARDLTMWEKVVQAVNDWLVRHGFVFQRYSAYQIEKMVASAQRKGLEADVDSMGGGTSTGIPSKIPDIRASANPADGPGQMMDRIDGTLNNIIKLADSGVPKIQGYLHKANMYLSTGFHNSEFYGRILGKLMGAKTQNAISSIERANGHASAIISKLNTDIASWATKVSAAPEKTQNTLNELMGESTRLGIFPNKPFESQPWLHEKSARGRNLDLYKKLVSQYKQPGVASLYDEALRNTERDYDLNYASLLKTIAFTFEAPDAIWKSIDPNLLLDGSAVSKRDFETSVKIAELWMRTQAGPEGVQALNDMLEFRAAHVQGPYFHLGRYGNYFARFNIAKTPEAQAALRKAMNESGQSDLTLISEDAKSAFLRFETEQQWIAVRSKLADLAKDGHVTDLKSGKLEENLNSLDSANLTFLQGMLGRIDDDVVISDSQKEATREMVRRLIVEMMPEATGSKQLARRSGKPGYAYDMRRNTVKRSSANAFFVAHNSTRPEIMEGFKAFRSELAGLQNDPTADPKTLDLAGDVLNHLKLRLDNSMRPIHTPNMDKLSALGYTMFLASNPPYIIANMMQPLQTTLPFLGARHGFAKSAGAMFRSMSAATNIIKDTIRSGYDSTGNWKGILDAHLTVDRADLMPAQKDAMKAFIDSGRLEFTQQHGLGRITEGENEGMSTVLKTVGLMSHYSEAFNRIISGLSAYDLEFARLKSQGMSETEAQKQAVDYGLKMIAKTQFLYDTENRALALSKRGVVGQATPLVTGFQQFSMQMLSTIVDLVHQSFKGSPQEQLEASRTIKGMLATTTVLAGVMGLPMMAVVGAVYNSLGSDDDPADLRSDLARWLSNIIGADAANVIMHGAVDPTTGATLSTRVSLADIIPFSKFLEDRRELKDRIEANALGWLGPSVGAVVNIGVGASKIADGDLMKGMIMMLPAALQGPLKYADLEKEGFTTGKGDKLPIAATSWEKMLQAANFTPAIKTELMRNVRSEQIRNAILSKRKTELGRKMAKALEDGDLEAQQKIGRDIYEFNLKNPDRGEVDIGAILMRRERNKAVARISETGVGGAVVNLPGYVDRLQGSTSTELRERLRSGL